MLPCWKLISRLSAARGAPIVVSARSGSLRSGFSATKARTSPPPPPLFSLESASSWMVARNAVKQIGSTRGRIANYASWHSCFWLARPANDEPRKPSPGRQRELRANPELVGGHERPRSPDDRNPSRGLPSPFSSSARALSLPQSTPRALAS